MHAPVPVSPAALAVAPGGGLYLVDGKRILERLPSGRFVVYASGLKDPRGIAEHDGTLYVADVNRVVAVSHGALRTVFRTPSATAVTFDRQGRLVVASSEWGVVLRGTTVIAGRRSGPQGIAPGSDDGADGLAYDRAGNLFLSGINTKTLLMVDTHARTRLPIGLRGFYPRGAGGIVPGPGGTVYAMETQDVDTLAPHSIHRVFTFTNRTFDGIRNFLPGGIAVARDGTIYLDTALGNGWTNRSAIVALRDGKLRVLWRGPT
ncbi:MAG TPA: hypothetical protein VGN06_02875 [Gaiellaceae bacterium]